MEKDPRYKAVKVLIVGRHITEFKEIFTHVPKTIMAHDLGTNNNRMTRLIRNVEQFTLADLYKISELLDVDYKTIFSLAHAQHFGNDKKGKRNLDRNLRKDL
jgi:plasmid maintenance system antidote protein VapI